MLAAQKLTATDRSAIFRSLKKYLGMPLSKIEKEKVLIALLDYDKASVLIQVSDGYGDFSLGAKKFMKSFFNYDLTSIKTIPPEVAAKIDAWALGELFEELEKLDQSE